MLCRCPINHHRLLRSGIQLYTRELVLLQSPDTHHIITYFRLGVKRRGREICKSFELNQTCPTSKTTAAEPSPINARPKDEDPDRGVVPQLQCFSAADHRGSNDVSLSSIYSSNPSYFSLAGCSSASKSLRQSARKRAVMEKIRGECLALSNV